VLPWKFLNTPEVFVDRITRKELKSDTFAVEIGQTVNLFEQHKQEIVRYGGIAVGVVVILLGYFWYSGRQHSKRQEALARAIQAQEIPVGPVQPGSAQRSFPTQEVKDEVAIKAFSELQTTYSGSNEAQIANYYLGSIKADQGKLAEAEKLYLDVAERADDKYASLAKLALAQIYFADGRNDQGESVLRGLINKPTPFVSKEQATILLARAIAPRKPAEAKQLLDPLRTVPGAIGSAAISAYAELPQ
jgi:predicted negative regulator of RcsB-dependent stress response